MISTGRLFHNKSRGVGPRWRPLALEALERREVPTISNLLPTLAELEGSTTDIQYGSLTLNNQQRVALQGTNVGGEVAIHSFTPAWTGTYNFTAGAVRSKMDSVIAIYDADGKRIAFNDDASLRTLNSQAAASLVAGTTYKFAVTSYDTTSVGKYSIGVAGVLQDDRYENNDTLGRARTISGAAGVTLSAVMADAHDYYRFSLATAAAEGSSLTINFTNDQGNLDLRLLDSTGTVLRASTGIGDQESIDISGLAAGKYFIDVNGFEGAHNPAYQMVLSAATAAPPSSGIPGDALESNNTRATASDLGTITANKTVANLSITRGDVDYLKFSLAEAGNATSEVLVNFSHSKGDIDAEIYDSAGKRLAVSQSVSDQERFSLDGFAAGTYFVRAFGYRNATNPSYSITINHDPGAGTSPTDPPTDPPVDPPANPSQGSWTLMVYMTATDLATFGFQDVNEMEDALTRLAPGVNITLFWDQWNQRSFATGGGTQAAWGTAGRAVLASDANLNSVATTFDIIGERNSGDPATLRDFITWSAANAPAANYGLVMWNHGGGLSGVNFDDESGGNSITIGDLRSAITQAGVPLQVLAYDACLMGLTEQAYEARDLATVQLASEEVIDGPGYNYRTIFQALNSSPESVSASALAQGIVNSFTASYGNDGFSTYSVVASASMTGVATSLRTFTTASASLTSANLTAVRSILAGVTKFDFPEYVDLRQFMQRVSTTASLPAAFRSAAGSVVTAVGGAVVARMADSRQTGGLAIYLPSTTSQESSAYGMYSGFDTATGWSTFVNRMLGRAATSRMTTGSGLGGAAQRGTAGAGRSAFQGSPSLATQGGLVWVSTADPIRFTELEAVPTNSQSSTVSRNEWVSTPTVATTNPLVSVPMTPRSESVDALFSGLLEGVGVFS